MKKLWSFLLIINIFLSSAHATDVTGESLRLIFDEFQYALQVEWDQKDPAFLKKEEQKLEKSLSHLYEQGLTQEQVISLITDQLPDQKVKSEIIDLMKQIELKELSKKEAQKMAVDLIKKSYQQGASWTGWGETLAWVGAGVFMAVWIGLLVWACSSPSGCNVSVEVDESYYDDYYYDDYYDDDYYEDGDW